MSKIYINRSDFYQFNEPILRERTKKRLIQLNEMEAEEVGFAEFGVKGIWSGLYIEKVWALSTDEWDDYIEWVKTLK